MTVTLFRKYSKLHKTEYYITTVFDGAKAEFCQEGNIKVVIFIADLEYMKSEFFAPSQEDLELFYNLEINLYYVPLFFNARLL